MKKNSLEINPLLYIIRNLNLFDYKNNFVSLSVVPLLSLVGL